MPSPNERGDSGKVRAVIDLIRLDRPYGTLLVMLPTLWSLFLASDGRPPLGLLAVFIAGAFLMRSAGCTLNDLADRNIDRFVARTRERPIPSGRLQVWEALLILLTLLLLSASLLFFLNPLARRLSLIALGVAVFYPFAKRVTSFPQVVLGAAFSFGPILAWAAIRGELGTIPFLILLATLCWTVGYDTIYAMMDREDDRKVGVGSTALLFGDHAWLAVGILYLMTVFFLAWVGDLSHLGRFYRFTLLLIMAMLAYQITVLRMNPSPSRLFSLFKSNVGVGLLIFLGIYAEFNL